VSLKITRSSEKSPGVTPVLSAFNSYMRQNTYHSNFKCIFEDLLPCYCYATKANIRT